MALSNCILDTWPKWVLQTDNSDQGQTLLGCLFVLQRIEVISSGLELLPLGFIVVRVGEQESSIALASETLDNVLIDNPISFLRSHFHNVSPLADIVDTFLNDDLWGTLNKDANLAGLAWVLYDSRGALALRIEWQFEDDFILLSLLDQLLSVHFALGKILDEADFGHISCGLLHAIIVCLNERCRVPNDTLSDEL